jgi:nitroimidazol reductase NimA-like FMN-containing flavoprotein (pyridoxamine 5'-phosphate oxidase superfamily)
MLIEDMTVEECWQALAKAGFGRLACARDNQPYVTPIHFVVEEDHVYSFSMAGQKIEWMRSNPRVCLEFDSMVSRTAWTSVIAFGRYDELPLDWPSEGERVRQLLQREAMWWQPAAVLATNHVANQDSLPIYYRIQIDRLSGRRGVPAPDEEPGGPGRPLFRRSS